MTASAAKQVKTTTGHALPILSLAVGTFGIGTGEFAMMGLLPDVARSMDASIPQCGNIVSAYAMGVVVGAPIISLASARMSRKQALILLTLWFAVTNILGTLAHSVGALEFWRFLAGLPHGTLFGGSALTAASLVAEGRRGKAVGHVFAGLTVANVVGAPLASLMGEYLSWRVAYLLVGAIALIAAFMIWRFIPRDDPRPGHSLLGELRAFGRKQIWYVLGVVMLGTGGMFCVYTYVSAALLHVTHVPLWSIPLFQALWGVGMVVGAYVGASAIDRNPLGATIGAFIWNVVTLSLFAFALPHLWSVTIIIFLLGGTIALGPAMQMRLMAVAGDAQTMAASMNHAAFNLANALGAWVGAFVLASGFGYAATGWAGGGIAVMGLLLFLLSVRGEPRLERSTDSSVRFH
ncbi:MFS transporter [Acetobacter sp. DsW_063]|uniref:MFS transporter n=1 Tax=Acetobacter sp. DsW_063 TaxID=1514894 RepID=UPI001302DC29|nr:MFS transporter [Acetobacter sp. DsW_063]